MPFADGASRTRVLSHLAAVILAAALGLAAAATASPLRVGALGGEGRLLLDSTNLFDYPALACQLAHVDVELFDDWAGAALPVGSRHAVGLWLNRPDAGTRQLADYVSGSGSRLLRSLTPRPWLDAIYALRLGDGIALGAALRYDYDLRSRGADEAWASRREARLGAALGSGRHQLDAAVVVDGVGLQDRAAGVTRSQTDGTGIGVDLRGRWRLSPSVLLLPSLTWRRSAYGLAPEARRVTYAQGALGANVRPTATVLGVAGIILAVRTDRTALPDDRSGATMRRSYLLPALAAGGEVQFGALLLRLGLRHESVLREVEGAVASEREFEAGLTPNVGIGFERGPVAVDGMLEKDFLRDGPDFVGGSPRGGGLLSALSLLYRFYP